MAETSTHSKSEENCTARSQWLGPSGWRSGGLVFLVFGLLSAYLFGVGQSVKHSPENPVEASLQVLGRLRSVALNVESNHLAIADRTEKPSEKSTASPSAISDVDRDRAYRRLLVGKWETECSGHRELTVRPDGTATMVVRLVGLNAAIFGEKLTFWIKWTIQNGKLAFSTIGGRPDSQVKIVTVMYGTSRTQKIRSLTKDRLLLIDEEGAGNPDHDYRRIATSAHE